MNYYFWLSLAFLVSAVIMACSSDWSDAFSHGRKCRSCKKREADTQAADDAKA